LAELRPVVSFADLPAVLRIFPLDGVILPPRGLLPLLIFEPRYLAMVRDAMAGDQLIGMVQPRANPESERPPLYKVGGLGRITQFSETGDGRFRITLAGLTRFRIVSEIAVATPYRQVQADYASFAGDWTTPPPLAPAERMALESTFRDYLESQELSADWDAVKNSDDESLVHTLATACPFSAVERQALLEASDLTTRTRTLTALMALSGSSEGTLQ